jgi:hypothetical protein
VIYAFRIVSKERIAFSIVSLILMIVSFGLTLGCLFPEDVKIMEGVTMDSIGAYSASDLSPSPLAYCNLIFMILILII